MKIIDIINGRGFYKDKTPQLLTDNQIELLVNLPDESGQFFLISKNGKKIFKTEISNGLPFTLNDIEAGEFSSTVNHYLRGELINVYPCEKLLLKDIEANIYAVPEIVESYKRLDEVEKRVTEIEEKNKILLQAFAKINERLKIYEKNNSGD